MWRHKRETQGRAGVKKYSMIVKKRRQEKSKDVL